MKRSIISLLMIVLVFSMVNSQSANNAYLDYIKNYSPIAVEQQKLHRIPASIKLAQGLLESAAGRGELVRQSNNHFGIKCSDWGGETVYADDDKKQECFRKYRSARESYEDHSLFLISRSRYASLFELQPTDYKAWAYGLKSAGYATDPGYANKLIKLIDDYDLHQFDLGKQPDFKRSDSKHNGEVNAWGNAGAVSLKGHPVYRNNGVKCVFAVAGDTYASIANEFELKSNKLLEYNDLNVSKDLTPGTVVYIAKKKKMASSEFRQHTVKDGENMYRIAQKYAILLQNLYDLNNMPYNEGASVGKILILRQHKK